MEAKQREILICHDSDDSKPFQIWLDSLDPVTRGVVRNRIDRIEEGLLGDTRSVGGGVTELKIGFRQGLRVYFGQIGNEVHLISGGAKSGQERDIAAAKDFWKRNHD